MSLIWKVYHRSIRNPGRLDLVGACKYAEDAAVLASTSLHAVIKINGRIVWREGEEWFSAEDSFDDAVQVMVKRKNQHLLDRLNKRNALEGTP